MAIDFTLLATPSVHNLHPYLPGKPASELHREQGLSEIAKLASNENPLGPSKQALLAMQSAAAEAGRYPDSTGYNLKSAIAAKYAIASEQITLGNGSNDVLELIARAFLRAGDEVVFSEYAFLVYALATQACGAKAVVAPAKDWGHDLAAMLAAISEQTRIVFIANPNNPTGTWLNKQQLIDFLDKVPEQVLVVLDEAYIEYCEHEHFPDGIALLQTYPNLMVTRTFSKAYGLAGLRVGFAVSNTQVANILSRIRQPFNVNHMALAAAEAALGDAEHLVITRKANTAGMALYEEQLQALGIDFIPSLGNFICVDCQKDAQPIYQKLLEQGVIVRPLANYAMPNHLRISIGTKAENEKCLYVLAKVMNDFENK